jgi:hypothetical protein
LIGIPIFFINQFGGLAASYLTAGDISATNSITSYIDQGRIVNLSGDMGIEYHIENYVQYSIDPTYYPQAYQGNPQLLNLLEKQVQIIVPSTYFVVTQNDEAYYKYMYDRPDFVQDYKEILNNTSGFNLIFANNDVSIYFAYYGEQ